LYSGTEKVDNLFGDADDISSSEEEAEAEAGMNWKDCKLWMPRASCALFFTIYLVELC